MRPSEWKLGLPLSVKVRSDIYRPLQGRGGEGRGGEEKLKPTWQELCTIMRSKYTLNLSASVNILSNQASKQGFALQQQKVKPHFTSVDS